jgi:GNAT superfamily N-acetyltransferase
METVVTLSGRLYRFRSLQLTEVPCVNRMLCAEYGDSYPYPLRAERLQSQSVYIVCVNEQGEIVAFSKAEYRNPGFYEVGGLIIDPRHRVAGLGTAIVEQCITEAYSRGAHIIFAEPVCYRPDHASQRLFLRLGFRHVAVELFKYPNIQKSFLGDQAETVTVGVLPPPGGLLDLGRPLFVPADYVRPLELLLGRPATGSDQALVSGPMPETVSYEAVNFEGYLGSDFCDVPANWPEAVRVIEDARAEGFLFSGIMPSFGHRSDGTTFDYLRLYRPPTGVRPDFDRVHVVDALRPFVDEMRTEHHRRYA